MNNLPRLRQIISEAVRDAVRAELLEDKVVKFGGQVYPKFGQCVIMAGGSGSGKGHAQNTYIPIDAKVIDVDAFKGLYTDLLNRPDSKVYKDDIRRMADPETNGDMLYDVTNPEDTSALHFAVDSQGWKETSYNHFFDPDKRVVYKGGKNYGHKRLPNVIIDTTGKNTVEVRNLTTKAKALGYTTTLVWVVTSRDRAITQALGRERQVSQSLFHNIHNDLIKKLPPFLLNDAGDYFDYAWIVFNSSVALSPKTQEEETSTCLELHKSGGKFVISDEDKKRLYDILGPEETNPNQPEVYKDFSEVAPKEQDYYKNRKDDEIEKMMKMHRTPKPIRKNRNLDRLSHKNAKAGDHLRRN